jgi:D-alanyl-lipoteichoic acid acyltransferase DltB (MBOAT superfamily)
MVFNSLTFIVFFVGVLILHNLPLPWTVKKVNLLLASCLFYAAWNPPFVLLLLLSAVVDFHLARWLGSTQEQGRRRAILAASLALNLGLLSYFKYGGFLLDNFKAAVALLGVDYRPPRPDIILPLGISFYTFETISYLIDVYRRRITPWHSFVDYALFLTFFPHLVAGPIVRAHDFLPQCVRQRAVTSQQFLWGCCLVLIGLFEKVILADAIMAPTADKVFDAIPRAGHVDAWIGTLAFSGQIFMDFAGYSLCGIGVALCFGFVLNDNFHSPYAAIGFSDFWQRWHMSLSSWLRDYLYIPLGGNRGGARRTQINLMLTMLLGGLWHGAAWRFIVWGGLHGLYLVGERVLRRLWGKPVSETGAAAVSLAFVTFVIVSVTWVFFRATDFAAAARLLQLLVTPTREHFLVNRLDVISVVLVIAAMLWGHWTLRTSSLEHAAARTPWWLRGLALAAVLACLVLAPGEDRAFIYFQF